jgi:hypothetical protein
MEWKKAGGELGDQQHKLYTRANTQKPHLDLNHDFYSHQQHSQIANGEPDLLKSLANVVFELFSRTL